MQESLVPQLHLQTKHKIYAIKSKEQQKIGLIYTTLPRENCWQGCTAMICNEKVSLIGPSCQIWRSNQNKYTWGTNLARIRDLANRYISVNLRNIFAKYSECEDLGRGLETWKIQNVGGRGHRVERYGGPNAWKQRSSWKNQGKEMCSFSKKRSGGKIVAISIGLGFWRPISQTQLKVNFCRKYLSLESTASRFLYGHYRAVKKEWNRSVFNEELCSVK